MWKSYHDLIDGQVNQSTPDGEMITHSTRERNIYIYSLRRIIVRERESESESERNIAGVIGLRQTEATLSRNVCSYSM